jgi:hypothetical protein
LTFFRLEVGGLAYIEEHTYHTTFDCLMYQKGEYVKRNMLINPLNRPLMRSEDKDGK